MKQKNLLLPLLTVFTLGILASSPLPSGFAQPRELLLAEQLLSQGVEQLDSNQVDAALQTFQQSLNNQKQSGNRFGEAAALHNLGITYYYQGQYDQAIATTQQAMQIFWRSYESPNSDRFAAQAGIAASLNNQSIVYLELGDYQKAIELCHGAIAIFRNMGDLTREAAALNNIGLAYEKLNDYERAIGYYQEALATAQANDDPRGEAITLDNLAEAYSKLGQPDQVKETRQQALAIREQIDQPRSSGGTISSNDYLLVRQNARSLALVFSNL